jgi:phenylpropionate dioxygenase-like ring-hydroxylating dioxygenase large terminal subunit
MKVDIPTLNLPLSENVSESYTLSSEFYLSADLYEQEKEKIFYRSWQYVAHESMLQNPGDYITLKICDQNIFAIRTDEGDVKAFYNVCQHRAHELLKGSGNVAGAIVCPYHAWTYKKNGNLLAARMGNKRPGFDVKNFGLKAIKLEIFCGCIFVNLDDSADSLNVIASDLAEDIRARVPYLDQLINCGGDLLGETVNKAGWKVVVDNFLECYHCTPAHPDFASLIDMSAYEVDAFELWSRQIGAKIRNENTAYNVDPNKGNQSSIAWFLWPNTTFNVLPGKEEFAVYAIRPTDLETCSFEGHSLGVNGDISQERIDYTADILVPEDISLCESVQRGLKSKGYDQGPYIYDAEREGISEHGLHHFHRLVDQALRS